MWRVSNVCVFLVLSSLLPAQGAAGKQPAGLTDQSLDQLEQRLAEIDNELEDLALATIPGMGTGTGSYRSENHQQARAEEWIQIDLDGVHTIDQVVLVPMIMNLTTGIQSPGFPAAFRLLAGAEHGSRVIAVFTEKDSLLPRTAPLIISCAPVEASWIRLEAFHLSERGLNDYFVLELSEIMVFDGLENVALGSRVSASSSVERYKFLSTRFLVDGSVPYLMHSAQSNGAKATTFRSQDESAEVLLSVDLERPHAVNQIQLHCDYRESRVPNGFEVPGTIKVTGANREDFSDEVTLFEYEQKNIFDIGAIITWRFPETVCRFVRFNCGRLPANELGRSKLYMARFAEIEILSHGVNLAKNKTVQAPPLYHPANPPIRLTDGKNTLGDILPLRNWMNQLAKRHDLEIERPEVTAELNRRYALQKRNLNIMYWLAAGLAAGTVIIVLLERMIRQRAVFRTQKRIAANLHDELGANLHAARVYSDLLKKEAVKGDGAVHSGKLIQYADEINAITEQAAKNTRFCTNMLEAKELYENPAEEMKRTAKQFLIDQEHDISFTGEEMLKALHPRRRIGLVLFYKECLTNIIRHSGATRVETRLTADRKRISLTVNDNGKGMDTASPSLKRRARLLKAKLSVSLCAGGGTETELRLKIKKQCRRRVQ